MSSGAHLLAHTHEAAALAGGPFLALVVLLLAVGASVGHVADAPGRPAPAATPTPHGPAWRPSAASLPQEQPPGLRRPAALVAAAGCAGAALVHVLVVPEHLAEHLTHGLFFVALALAHAVLAVALLRRPTERTLRLTVDGHVCVLLLWLGSRTSGVTLVTGREPVGGLDTLCALLELAAVAACVSRRTVPAAGLATAAHWAR